ncbi:MAG: hypothetical protein RDU24_07020 [Humidesulfovibrio sp.]|uniref:hypothetical protein n=1 Tax=Humidesulfovibrio sp. TaxID=2910988 RepID=UPI0027F9B272|nr:hypothetical protein [Humidesulfovibrio sp.]MDQ7835118.1 hypothetical protein [Humidesulfovibrio sp.]
MNTAMQIIVRVAFVAMLIVGAACSKKDSQLQESAAADVRGGLTSEQAQAIETERMQELHARVEYMQAQLKDVHPLSAKANVPGGDYID